MCMKIANIQTILEFGIYAELDLLFCRTAVSSFRKRAKIVSNKELLNEDAFTVSK